MLLFICFTFIPFKNYNLPSMCHTWHVPWRRYLLIACFQQSMCMQYFSTVIYTDVWKNIMDRKFWCGRYCNLNKSSFLILLACLLIYLSDYFDPIIHKLSTNFPICLLLWIWQRYHNLLQIVYVGKFDSNPEF